MDIIAKAKPVRFRIVSGEVECTSLDDLRTHFDLKSVADTINDGRLEKWLNYIKEFDFAKQVKEIGKFDPSDMEMSLRVLSLFTGEEYGRENFNSDIEYIEFLDKDKNTSKFAHNLIKESMHKDVDVLLYAYHNHTELITDVHECFKPFLETSIEVMWLYGKFLIESKNEETTGIEYIKNAANNGHKEAVEFVQGEGRNLDNEQLKSKITSIIASTMGPNSGVWRSNSAPASRTFINLASSNNYPQEVKDIFKVFSKFSELARIPQMWMIRDALKHMKNQNFGTAQKIFDFIYLYAREEMLSMDYVISCYRKLNYPPATIRAQEFRRGKRRSELVLATKQDRYIQMTENPGFSQFIHFLYSFMANIMYI